MFSNDRTNLRKFFFDAWQKHLSQEILQPLEAQIVNIILLHPEYHTVFNDADNQDKDFSEVNPFLHLSLHLALYEQLNTNRPAGIKEIHKNLCEKLGDPHLAEHHMMNCLAEIISSAQASGQMPDEKIYLEALRKL